MPNPFPLLVHTGRHPLARSLRSLLTGYAGAFNRRYRRSGHVLQNRYKSVVCDEAIYLLELVRDLHLNPLRAQIVVDLEGLANSAYSGPAAAQALGVHPATIYEVARRGRPAVLIMDSSLSRKRFAYSGLPGALTGQNENYWWPPGSDYWEQLCTDAKPQSPCNVP